MESRTVRLLYLCSDYGIRPTGTKGASIHLRAITRALAELGHEVRLLSPHQSPNGDHPLRRLIQTGGGEFAKSIKTLKHWLVDHDLDDTVARELRPLLYNSWAPRQAVKAVGEFPPAAIVERLSLLGHVGLDLAEAWHVPLIVEVNALLTEESRSFRKLQLGRLADAIERRVLERADAILAVSAPLAERIAELGICADKIHVVPNGVDLRVFENAPSRSARRATLGLRDEFVIGFCGSLKSWHGVDVLLAAFAEFLETDPAARLLIVGSGPAEESLRAAVETTHMNASVTFTGAVPHSEVAANLRAMDVAVAPFKSMDGFYFSPIKLFEYMAADTCVVASKLGQIQDVITDGVNGLLCRPDDAHDLCAALIKARQSKALRARLASAALQTVRNRYTWQRAAETTSRVIESAVNRRAGVARDGVQAAPAAAATEDQP